MNWPPNSPNTHYLHGDILGDFVYDYCDRHGIHVDAWVFNLELGPTKVYSENEATARIEEIATKWHLRTIPHDIRTEIFNA